MKKKGIFVIIVIAIILIFLMYRRAKYEARVAFNKNEIAGIDLAIGHALQRGCTETNMMEFIRREYPRFHFSTNGILDLYRNAVRFRSEENADSFFVGVYSSGADGVWETRDDIKRESNFKKTSGINDSGK